MYKKVRGCVNSHPVSCLSAAKDRLDGQRDPERELWMTGLDLAGGEDVSRAREPCLRKIAMSGHKPWSQISTKLRTDPERRARIEQHEQAIEVELTISQLREALGATQESVAERVNVTQSNVSRFER